MRVFDIVELITLNANVLRVLQKFDIELQLAKFWLISE